MGYPPPGGGAGGGTRHVLFLIIKKAVGSMWALESPQAGFTAWMIMSYVPLRTSHQPDERPSVLANNASLTASSRIDPADSRPSVTSASFVTHRCSFSQDGTPRPHGPLGDSQGSPGLSVAGTGRPRKAPGDQLCSCSRGSVFGAGRVCLRGSATQDRGTEGR